MPWQWPWEKPKTANVVKSGDDLPNLKDIWPTFGTDKCDRCPSYAKVRVLVTHVGLVIDFCGHHFRKHHKEFDKKGYTWIDGRSEKERFSRTMQDISGNL